MQNEKGQIAVRRFRLREEPFPVHIPPDKDYLFITRNNVCLAWIDPEDVEKVLATRRRCCGTTVQQFYLASDEAAGIHGG
jgi:hypothetical protein